MTKRNKTYPGIEALGEVMEKSPLINHMIREAMKKAEEMDNEKSVSLPKSDNSTLFEKKQGLETD